MDTKKLMAAMREAYRGAGYQVEVCDGRLYISAGVWGLVMMESDVPNKIKGLLAEHLGFLPREEFGASLVDKDEVNGCGSIWAGFRLRQEKFAAPDAVIPIRRTPLTLDGFEIWQQEDLSCRVLSADYTGILPEKQGQAVFDTQRMELWIRHGLYFLAVRTSAYEFRKLELEELGRFQWWRD